MFKVTHFTLVLLSGSLWLAIGCFLLPLGLNLNVEVILKENLSTMHRPILDSLAPYVGGLDQALLWWIGSAFLVGFLKGRYVFTKTVQRSVNRILSFPQPVSIGKIYPLPYYLLLGSMIGLGVLMRWTPHDVRGGVDVMVGAALITGALQYFRYAWAIPHQA